ncbi:hypothetical protein E9556_12315 [Staphylococcus pseudintermedius]|nr:hypothetical protein [Staphylococcus pseudintermedius]RYS21657.1 hypothetical protein DLS46_09075 [Staphylococcus pseudintermedius]
MKSMIPNNVQMFSWDIKKITDNFMTHSLEKGSEHIKIAVVDSGVDIEHPGLKKNINQTFNYVLNERENDLTGHGTMVCGQICGYGLLKGIVPDCKVDVYKVLNKNNKSSVNRVLRALHDIAKSDYHVVNLSLGFSLSNIPKPIREKCEKALKKLYDAGTICISTVGYTTQDHFPSFSDYVITAQSLSKNGKIVNKELNAIFALYSGDYLNIELNKSNYDDELVSVYIPIDISKKALSYCSNEGKFPLGYSYSIGESLASAKLSGVIIAIISHYYKMNKKILNFDEVIFTLKKYSAVIENRHLVNLYKALNDINKGVFKVG